MVEIPKDLQELLLDDKTKEEFGYSAFDLSRGSMKFIYHKCFVCSKEKKSTFREFIKSRSLTHPGKCYSKFKKQMNFKKYGVEYVSQLEIVKQKVKNTNLEKYGVENSLQSKKVREKIRQTMLKKYGVEHALQSKEIRDKKKQTCLKKYGVEHALQSKEIRDKIKQTNLQKYGVENPNQSKKIRDKGKQTCLEKYGVSNPSQLEEIKERKKLAYLKKYGVEHALQSKEIRDKIKQTNLKRYGTTNFLQSKEAKQKTKQTNLRRYGTENPNQNRKVREKIKQTNLKRYGTEYPQQSKEIKEKIKQAYFNKDFGRLYKRFSKDYWLQQSWNGCKINPNQKLSNKWSQGNPQKIEIICSCGKVWKPQFSDLTSGRCKSCGHGLSTSFAEQEVLKFIQDDLKINCGHRYKFNKIEFDIYIPDQQVCIEYNGLRWHSEQFTYNKLKDYNKYLFCKENNLRYIGIFEDEWIYHQDRVKNYLKTILGHKDQIKIRPQELTIKYLDRQTQEIRDFLSKYHYLPNYTTLKHIWISYYNNKIIAVLGIGSPTRQTIKEPLELKRVCLHPDYKCYGLWSFLFKHHVKQLSPTIITSFSDNRRDTGNLYRLLGFEEVKQLRPDYYWCKGNQRFHKSNFKKTAEERLTGKTETELREVEGFFKIWDCGKTKWNLKI